ncbi:hypothetical protein Dimus_031107 [Dionaea muscipula]
MASSYNRSWSFTQACNLLSQYIKEKRTFDPPHADHGTGIKGTTTTMDLFPQEAGFGSSDTSSTPQPAAAGQTMTMFYAGRVVVFDFVPANTAKEIIQLASNYSSRPSAATKSTTSTGDHGRYCYSSDLNIGRPNNNRMMKASDLPMARKGSLQRFFEKRKDRISARAAGPYSLINRFDSAMEIGSRKSRKPSETKPSWLGLTPPQSLEPGSCT